MLANTYTRSGIEDVRAGLHDQVKEVVKGAAGMQEGPDVMEINPLQTGSALFQRVRRITVAAHSPWGIQRSSPLTTVTSPDFSCKESASFHLPEGSGMRSAV